MQFADEAAARTWVTEQRARLPDATDLESYASLNVKADFDNWARGAWYISPQNSKDSETPEARAVNAVFYKHDIAVHVNIVMLTDRHIPAVDAA